MNNSGRQPLNHVSDEEEDKACTIQVPVAQTTDSGTKLGLSVTISAAEGAEPRNIVSLAEHISPISRIKISYINYLFRKERQKIVSFLFLF